MRKRTRQNRIQNKKRKTNDKILDVATHQSIQTQIRSSSRSGSGIDERARILANRNKNIQFGSGINKSIRRNGARRRAFGLVSGNGEAFGGVSNIDGAIGVGVRKTGQGSNVDLLGQRSERLLSERNRFHSNRRTGSHGVRLRSRLRLGLGQALSSGVENVSGKSGSHGHDVIIIPTRGSGRHSVLTSLQSNRVDKGNSVFTSQQSSSGGKGRHSLFTSQQSSSGGKGRHSVFTNQQSNRGSKGRHSDLTSQQSSNVFDLLSNSGHTQQIKTNERSLIETRNRLNQLLSLTPSQMRGRNTHNNGGMVILPLSLVKSLLRRSSLLRNSNPTNVPRGVFTTNVPRGVFNRGTSSLSSLSALLNSRNFELERKEPTFLLPSPAGQGTLLPPDLSEESLLLLAPLLEQHGLGSGTISSNIDPTQIIDVQNLVTGPVKDTGSQGFSTGSSNPFSTGGTGYPFGWDLLPFTLGLTDFPDLEVMEDIIPDVPDKQIKLKKKTKRKPKKSKKGSRGQKKSTNKKSPSAKNNKTKTAATV